MSKTIFEALRDDHDSQRALFEEVARAGTDPEERRELFCDLKLEMRSHARAEEEALLGHLLDHVETRALAERSITEHAGLAHAVEELDAIGFAGPAWLRDFARLRSRAERQLDDEERLLFRAASEVLTPVQCIVLAAHYQREKRAALRA